MAEYKFRLAAKIVAIIDLIYNIILTLFFLMFLTVAVFVSIGKPEDVEKLAESVAPGAGTAAAAWSIWLVTLVFFVSIVFSWVAIVKLLKATKQGADPEEALPRAKFWRIVFIVFTVLGCLNFIVSASWLTLAVTLVIFCLFLYPVWMYIGELQIAVSENAAQKYTRGAHQV